MSKARLDMPGWESTRGEDSRCAKLTEKDVRAIRSSLLSTAQLAKQFGCSERNIRSIVNRKTWRHVK